VDVSAKNLVVYQHGCEILFHTNYRRAQIIDKGVY